MEYWQPAHANKPADWTLRVVPNKFPALVEEGELETHQDGVFECLTGLGVHEVVIENPCHDLSFADYSKQQAEWVIQAYRDRIVELSMDSRFRYIMIFKNSGVDAGASLDHPHSQIISLPVVPKRVNEEMTGAKSYYACNDRCIFCDIVRQEKETGIRMVLQNENYVAITPYASRFPFEVWILPIKHESHFKTISGQHITDFALILRDVLKRIKTILRDPPYNFMLHTSPCGESSNSTSHYHWHLEITPKLTQVAGFEWGTGFYINPMPPEHAAAYLRGDKELDRETPVLETIRE